MSSSEQLRKNRNQHSVKNSKSKKMDTGVSSAMSQLVRILKKEYPTLSFEIIERMLLKDIINTLSLQYPNSAQHFSKVKNTSFIKPDGGFLFCTNSKNERRLILVSEVKRQGTNDKRKKEGLKKQAQGNAIERLGKNLIGIRTIFKHQGVLPFVCFGSGHDFSPNSSILDRAVTMNEFFPLNVIYVEKGFLPFEPVSMFFRKKEWSKKEMLKILHDVAKRSIEHKFI